MSLHVCDGFGCCITNRLVSVYIQTIFRELLVHAKVTYNSCCCDGVVAECRSMFVMGSNVVLLID